MRAFCLASLFAASVSALAIDRDTAAHALHARAAVGPALFVKRDASGSELEARAAHLNQRRPAGAGHKQQRLVRRRTTNKKCRAQSSATSAPSQAPTGASPSEDGQQPTSFTDGYQPTSTPTSSADYQPTPTDDWNQPSATSKSTDENQTSAPTSDWQPPTTSAEAPTSTDGWTQPTDGSSAPSSAPPSAPTGGSSGGKTGDGALFPIRSSNYWTTSDGSLPMQDALKLQAGKLPSITSAPDGTQAMVCNYPPGGIGGSSGFSFYSAGHNGNVDVTKSNHVMFSFAVFFDNDFDWVKGGKLPGLYGGASFETAKSCSGGDKKDDCFSTRLMWRADGAGEIYDYLPPSAHNDYCNTPPKSDCNPAFGDSLGRGAWTWQKNTWNIVALRVKLNDAGQSNGEHEVYINGESVLKLTGLTIRLSNDIKFQGIMSQTFFGGGDSSYAPPKEEHAYFKDWSLSILD